MIAIAIRQAIEQQEWIDRIAVPVQQVIRGVLERAPRLASVLEGDFLNHPLHPAVVTIPIGAWTAGLVLDYVGLFSRRFRRGADGATAIGLAGALVAALPGLADWSTTDGLARRVGFVHASINLTAAGLYGASLLSRAVGLRLFGIALSTTGYGLVGFSGWLGGELVYRYGVGVTEEACAQYESSQPGPEQTARGAY